MSERSLRVIDEQFKTPYKALASILNMKFSYMKCITVKGVCEHIIQMSDLTLTAQLTTLEIDMFDYLLVHYILHSFKISYNTHKDKW
jgi:hypothetical protein